MEQFIAKLTQLLRESFKNAEPELEPASPADRIAGFLVWGGFAGMPQTQRQREVWRVLRENLTKDEQFHVSAILTITPEERTVMDGNS
jgi:stress-induced morphogen